MSSLAILGYATKLLIAGLLVHAGVSKLLPRNAVYYRDVVAGYSVVPTFSVNAVVLLIGSVEVAIAISLFVPKLITMALASAACLFGVYFLVLAKQLMQGKADMNCGCAGPGADLKISPLLLLRNTALIGFCGFAASTQTLMFMDVWFLIVPCAAFLALSYLSAEQLIVNQQKIEILKKI